MWDAGALTDVTVSAGGKSISAHQVVLSSCSGYFKEVLQNVTAAQHPIIILPFTSYSDLLAVIQFMYKGEMNITQTELPGLLEVAETLRVKGLAKLNPNKASGLLLKACQQNPDCEKTRVPRIKVEEDVWNSNSLSFGEDEEAVEITEITEECDGTLVVDEDEGSDGNDSEDHLERCDDSNLSGSEQSEGKLYFLTSLGQHEEGGGGGTEGDKGDKPVEDKKKVRRRRNRGDLLWARSVAWDKERSNGRSTIRKTLLPVSCPVCFKVLSNAYNLKVHMSIHDGLNHQCSICGHTSKSRDALRKHLAYRHLIGQSGPVRPRQPTTKRRRGRGNFDESENNSENAPLNSGEDAAATPTPTLSDLENDALQGDSGGEDPVESNGHNEHMIFQ